MKFSITNVCIRRGQPLNKKAFTLIELLAVIAILSIIALIAVPIVINIIRDTKEKAIKLNAENYMGAVELAVADGHMVKGEKVLISGTYDIIENGKVIKLIKDSNDNPILEEKDQIELPVEYKGDGLKDGEVKLIDGEVRGLTGVKTDEGYDLLIIMGEVKIIKNASPVTLTTGQNFNAKIKTLVSGTDTKYNVSDTKVKSIEFLGYGIIPSGYTLEEFQKLERVDISSSEDEIVYAIYDGKDKVYVYA